MLSHDSLPVIPVLRLVEDPRRGSTWEVVSGGTRGLFHTFENAERFYIELLQAHIKTFLS